MPAILQSVEAVRHLDKQLKAAKKEVSRSLKRARTQHDLSLNEVGKKVRLSRATVNNIELGKSYSHPAASRLARFYDSLAA